jgi:hypothetical protein
VNEERYGEKVSGNARDINFEWKAMKILSDYFKIEHTIRAEITGLTDVEVEIDGKKKKMNKGRIAMEIKGALLKDPESKWDSHPTTRLLREIYDKYIIRGRVDAMEMKVADDVRAFKDQLKAFLELTGKRQLS